MKEDLGRDWVYLLAVFFAFLVCVCAVATWRALQGRLTEERGVGHGVLLEIVWINMPLCIVIALVVGVFVFRAEPGFVSKRGVTVEHVRFNCDSATVFNEKSLPLISLAGKERADIDAGILCGSGFGPSDRE